MALAKKNSFIEKFFGKLTVLLSNLKFAILILLIIAGFSIFGTVIEQNQSIEFYKQNYPESRPVFGLVSWKIIEFFSLNDVYRSWWYLSLLLILGMSLITCSFTQQLPMLKISKNWKFLKRREQLKTIELKVKLKDKHSSNIVHILNKETYNIFQQGDSFYCYKGIIGRIAPIFVHISIIQIFVGAVFGAFLGYGGQEMIPKTETFHLQNVINAGFLSRTPINTSVRINNFWIDYTESGENAVKQFYSDISLIDNHGSELRRKVISVNNPLHYKDLTLYQSDWDIVGLRGRLLGKDGNLQYQSKKIKTASGNRWLAQVKISDRPGLIRNILIKDLKKNVSLYDEKGEFLSNLVEGKSFEIESEKFLVSDIIPATGIDLKSDPGIPFVYLGFLLLITSTLLSFVSYSKIWIFELENSLFISGNSNRAKISFERYFLKLLSNFK